jgi:UDP-N-acetylglucosamine 2-epimerase (non-hydrolysing)
MMNEKIKKDNNFNKKLTLALNSLIPFAWSEVAFILVTGHRRENFGNGLLEICKAISEISSLYPQIHIIYSLHLNPSVREPVTNSLSGLKNVHLVEPLNYEHFVILLSKCMFVLTDSGGIQEEAPFLGKPVLVMRRTTERPEALDAGTARLVGTDSKNIVLEVRNLLEDETLFEQMSLAHSPYGDGTASDKIIKFLEDI